jgi:hypothetical protein
VTATGKTSVRLYKTPWVRGFLIICGVLLLVAAGIEGYKRLDRYANDAVEKRAAQLPVSIQLKDTPAWLDPAILSDILQTTVDLARRDEATFQRFQNPLDSGILDEIPAQYAAHLSDRANAWLKRINRIQRVADAAHNQQRIEICAEYRKPVAWVAVPVLASGERIATAKAMGDLAQCRDRQVQRRYCLVDADLVRLPGDYSEADRKAMAGLMAIYGVDEEVPRPGAAWGAPELVAGLKLAETLKGEPYAGQIRAINVSNYTARIRADWPQITLETVWLTPEQLPRMVYWGRPVGEHSFYEVSTEAKLKALGNLFARFSRIDAGRDYVDIRTEQIRVPKLAAQGDDAGPSHARS